MSSDFSGVRGVNHITLVVADLDRAVAFYRDVLGGVTRASGARAAYMALGSLWLCLEVGDPGPGQDHSHIALDCAADDFAALADRITSAAALWKANRSEGESVYFNDPDGHRLELHVGGLGSRLAHYKAHPDKGMQVF